MMNFIKIVFPVVNVLMVFKGNNWLIFLFCRDFTVNVYKMILIDLFYNLRWFRSIKYRVTWHKSIFLLM